jgi:hypothetical protein
MVHFADGKSGPEAHSVSALLGLRVEGKDILMALFGESTQPPLGMQEPGRCLAMYGPTALQASIGVSWRQRVMEPQARGWFGADVMKGECKEAIVIHGSLAKDNRRLGDVWILKFEWAIVIFSDLPDTTHIPNVY